jgi:hypothetical protein
MSRFRTLSVIGALAVAGSLSAMAVAQERTSPPRPGGGGAQAPSGSYQRTCRGVNMNGNMLSAQCPGPTGAPIFSSIDTNSCRGRDIANDRGYLRCSGGGPQPPRPPRPEPPRPPRPEPPTPPGGVRPPTGGNYEAILYTSADFRGRALRVAGPVVNLARYPGFNDNVRSIRILRGRAQVCVDAYYRGQCQTLSRSVSDLHRVGMGNRISSVR